MSKDKPTWEISEVVGMPAYNGVRQENQMSEDLPKEGIRTEPFATPFHLRESKEMEFEVTAVNGKITMQQLTDALPPEAYFRNVEVIPGQSKGTERTLVLHVRKPQPWVFGEMTEEDDRERFKPERMVATDLADQYRTKHRVVWSRPAETGYTVLEMLPELKGKPWNNMALNLVHALRPTALRVTLGEYTADAYPWRVTVFLEEDECTIKHIEQEVNVGTVGCRYGADVRPLDHGEVPEYQPTQTHFVNLNAIKKLDLHLGTEKPEENS